MWQRFYVFLINFSHRLAVQCRRKCVHLQYFIVKKELMMKRIMLILAVALTGITAAMAQKEEVELYMTVDELPNLTKCLPAPPAFDSPEFAADMQRYAWGKRQRGDSIRAEIVKGDAVWTIEALLHQFAVPFGLEVSEAETPEIYRLLNTAILTISKMSHAPKAYYNRQRPFERLYDATLTGEDDDLRGNGSYPSGHTMRGQSCALLMAEIAPERADTIMRRGWIYGESRVIAGAHWQSDVDAARVGASIGYGALQNNAAFRKQMEKAKREYRKLTGK